MVCDKSSFYPVIAGKLSSTSHQNDPASYRTEVSKIVQKGRVSQSNEDYKPWIELLNLTFEDINIFSQCRFWCEGPQLPVFDPGEN